MQNYDEEFKKMIVELNKTGKSIKELTKEYGISRASINNWKKLYTPLTTDENVNTVFSLSDYKKMQKEMAQLKEENEVLKKCVTIFSKK